MKEGVRCQKRGGARWKVRNKLKLSTWCVTPTVQTSSTASLNITSTEIFSLPVPAAVQHNYP